jgi:hypothetical protein
MRKSRVEDGTGQNTSRRRGVGEAWSRKKDGGKERGEGGVGRR